MVCNLQRSIDSIDTSLSCLSWFSILLLDKYNQFLSLIIVDRLLFLYDDSLNFEYSNKVLKILYKFFFVYELNSSST